MMKTKRRRTRRTNHAGPSKVKNAKPRKTEAPASTKDENPVMNDSAGRTTAASPGLGLAPDSVLGTPELTPAAYSAQPTTPASDDSSEPCSPPVPVLPGPELVKKAENFFRRYAILPAGLALVLALWVIATYLHQIFYCFPYVSITSPTKRCGKTVLAELVGLIAACARSTVNISEAALFRLIETFHPTIIMDESEALAKRGSERSQFMLSLLNAGHRRNAKVVRCVGSGHTPMEFPAYCPKVVIAIGNLPDTLRDRSIIVNMRRKRADEDVARFKYREVKEKGDRGAALIAAWAEAHKDEVAAAYETQALDFLSDREADNWESLFAIAAVAVPDRVEELKEIALRLGDAKNALDVDDSQAMRLLADIRQVFAERKITRMSTRFLISRLQAFDESRWRDMTATNLARILRPFGLSTRQLWIDSENVRGYELDDFKGAFDSYLPAATC